MVLANTQVCTEKPKAKMGCLKSRVPSAVQVNCGLFYDGRQKNDMDENEL